MSWAPAVLLHRESSLDKNNALFFKAGLLLQILTGSVFEGNGTSAVDHPVPGKLGAGRQILHDVANVASISRQAREFGDLTIARHFTEWYLANYLPNPFLTIVVHSIHVIVRSNLASEFWLDSARIDTIMIK